MRTAIRPPPVPRRSWGRAHAVDTRSVRVNGQPAVWVPWTASWTNASTALNPGINRVVVQAPTQQRRDCRDQPRHLVRRRLGGQCQRHARRRHHLDCRGRTLPGLGNAHRSAGSVLTIEPGTTVYFAQGAGLSVAGVLLAEGTEATAHSLHAAAGHGTTWNGIIINAAIEPAVLSHVDFEFARCRHAQPAGHQFGRLR